VADRSWIDLSHLALFVRDLCETSRFGEPLSTLYDAYVLWGLEHSTDCAPFGLFPWWMRSHHDTVWLGKHLGEWTVGVAVRCVDERAQVDAA
jgi:hypothetical protein